MNAGYERVYTLLELRTFDPSLTWAPARHSKPYFDQTYT